MCACEDQGRLEVHCGHTGPPHVAHIPRRDVRRYLQLSARPACAHFRDHRSAESHQSQLADTQEAVGLSAYPTTPTFQPTYNQTNKQTYLCYAVLLEFCVCALLRKSFPYL